MFLFSFSVAVSQKFSQNFRLYTHAICASGKIGYDSVRAKKFKNIQIDLERKFQQTESQNRSAQNLKFCNQPTSHRQKRRHQIREPKIEKKQIEIRISPNLETPKPSQFHVFYEEFLIQITKLKNELIPTDY